MSIWNLYAKVYDVINQNVSYVKMLDNVVESLDLHDGVRILDAGCGTGNFEKKVLTINSNVKITAVDFSDEMLTRAKKKKYPDRVNFKKMDLNKKTIFTDNYYDFIVSINFLYTLKKQAPCLNELYRILKPGGKIVIANPDDHYSFRALFRAQLQELGFLKFIFKFILNFPTLIIIIFVNTFYIKKNKFEFLSAKQLEGILYEIGFRDLNIKRTYADQDLLISAIK